MKWAVISEDSGEFLVLLLVIDDLREDRLRNRFELVTGAFGRNCNPALFAVLPRYVDHGRLSQLCHHFEMLEVALMGEVVYRPRVILRQNFKDVLIESARAASPDHRCRASSTDATDAGLHGDGWSALLPAPMHLRLSDHELATLVEMVSLAANVASWNQKESAADKVASFEDLESKILEKAGHSGMGDWIEFDEETRRFRIKQEVEERLFYHECYDEFRNESFWDELAVRLADRDLARAIGFSEWEKLTEEERRARTTSWEKRYWEEFSKHGVDRVVVVTPPGEG